MADSLEGRIAGRTGPLAIGQQLNYSPGLSAVTTVWVTAKFTEEHPAALGWLAEITLVRALYPSGWFAGELHEDGGPGAEDSS